MNIREIINAANMVGDAPDQLGVLSTSEQIAVALLLDHPDWLRSGPYPKVLDAIERLGLDDLRQLLEIHRLSWRRSRSEPRRRRSGNAGKEARSRE